MIEFKVGDKVVLRPETKPYTFTNQLCSYSEIKVELPENITYMVDYIHADGDIYIISNCWRGHIRPIHLKHAESTKKVKGEFSDFQLRVIPRNGIDTTELRLSIFNAKPNRTLEEMQAIEDWLLGGK